MHLADSTQKLECNPLLFLKVDSLDLVVQLLVETVVDVLSQGEVDVSRLPVFAFLFNLVEMRGQDIGMLVQVKSLLNCIHFRHDFDILV